jgi:Spy/CpxP family protein refolding chaperone
VSLGHVAVLTDRQNLHALERQEMLDSRRAKNLLNAVERHQADLDDPDMTDRLRAWLAIKPRLV